MKRSRKKYERPAKPYDKQRLERETEIMKKYGLKKKLEIWRTEAMLRKYRRLARVLAAKRNKEQEKILVEKLVKLGILNEGATLDDVLGLALETFLDRRLQTIVHKKGLTNTVKQARQMITHGHVRIDERRITYPSYLVSREEENLINTALQIATKVVKSAGKT